MSRGIIYNIEPFGYSPKAVDIWVNAGYTYMEGSWDDVFSSNEMKKVVGIIIRLKHFVGEDTIAKFPDLSFIVSATTGHDHIDLKILNEKNIDFFSLRNYKDFLDSIPSTAEHSWALILALIRNITFADMDVRRGFWLRDRFRGRQLKGKTIGIVGLGRTGIKIAHYARAFDMRVLFYDPFVKSPEYEGKKSLEDLLPIVDIVSLHVHLTPQTYNMINSKVLNFCKKGAFLINTSRGNICDELALVNALRCGNLSGIATDVLSTELDNMMDSPLWKAQQEGLNIVISPHIGGATIEAMQECEEFIAEIVIDVNT